MVNAESQYQQEQQKWLTSGLNEKTTAQNMAVQQQGFYQNAQTNQLNTMVGGNNSMQNLYTNQINQANQNTTNAGNMVTGGLQTLGYGAGLMSQSPSRTVNQPYPAQKNTTPIPNTWQGQTKIASTLGDPYKAMGYPSHT